MSLIIELVRLDIVVLLSKCNFGEAVSISGKPCNMGQIVPTRSEYGMDIDDVRVNQYVMSAYKVLLHRVFDAKSARFAKRVFIYRGAFENVIIIPRFHSTRNM